MIRLFAKTRRASTYASSPKNYREHFSEQTRRLSVGHANVIGTMTTNIVRHPFKALQAQQYRNEVIWFCIIR